MLSSQKQWKQYYSQEISLNRLFLSFDARRWHNYSFFSFALLFYHREIWGCKLFLYFPLFFSSTKSEWQYEFWYASIVYCWRWIDYLVSFFLLDTPQILPPCISSLVVGKFRLRFTTKSMNHILSIYRVVIKLYILVT